MTNMWFKIKVWSKVGLFVVVGIAVISFLLLNRNAEVSPALDLVYKKYDHPNMLLVLFLTSILSIFGWWLLRTIFKTLRQLRAVRERTRLERAKKDAEETIAKAHMVQTRSGDSGQTRL